MKSNLITWVDSISKQLSSPYFMQCCVEICPWLLMSLSLNNCSNNDSGTVCRDCTGVYTSVSVSQVSSVSECVTSVSVSCVTNMDTIRLRQDLLSLLVWRIRNEFGIHVSYRLTATTSISKQNKGYQKPLHRPTFSCVSGGIKFVKFGEVDEAGGVWKKWSLTILPFEYLIPIFNSLTNFLESYVAML